MATTHFLGYDLDDQRNNVVRRVSATNSNGDPSSYASFDMDDGGVTIYMEKYDVDYDVHRNEAYLDMRVLIKMLERQGYTVTKNE